MSNFIRLLAIVAFLIVIDARPANGAVYEPPVNAPISDSFRAPTTPYGPGNRGWEYSTTPGATVRAAADGTVTFAGQVGGVLNVVVAHDDGVLTTYSKLATISVHRGQVVHVGDAVGTANADVFFGARCNGQYVDPATLFDVRVYLVPDNAASVRSQKASSCAPAQTPISPAQIAWAAAPSVPDYWPALTKALVNFRL